MSLGSSCAGAVVVVVEVLRFRPDSNPEDEIALLGLTVVVKNCGSGVIIITRIIIMDYYYTDYYNTDYYYLRQRRASRDRRNPCRVSWGSFGGPWSFLEAGVVRVFVIARRSNREAALAVRPGQ